MYEPIKTTVHEGVVQISVVQVKLTPGQSSQVTEVTSSDLTKSRVR